MKYQYYYSKKTGGFYNITEKEAYDASINGWPSDAIGITDDEYKSLFEGQMAGSVIIADSNGKPILTAPQEPTYEQYVAIAENKRGALLSEASSKIAPLQDAKDLGIATEEELTTLKEWMLYRVQLSRVNLETAPDIDWPLAPDA